MARDGGAGDQEVWRTALWERRLHGAGWRGGGGSLVLAGDALRGCLLARRARECKACEGLDKSI